VTLGVLYLNIERISNHPDRLCLIDPQFPERLECSARASGWFEVSGIGKLKSKVAKRVK
jgi:hypothetical protein